MKETRMTCDHPRRGLFRAVFRNGAGYHVVERCLDCRDNVRGLNWVPREEVRALGLEPDDLPEDVKKKEGPTLFG